MQFPKLSNIYKCINVYKCIKKYTLFFTQLKNKQENTFLLFNTNYNYEILTF